MANRRRVVGWVAGVALLGFLGGGVVRAEDGEKPPAPLEFRSYDVSALTQGVALHRGERGPFAPQPGEVNDEEHPLFGCEQEESWKPFGSASDLLELLKWGVGAPGAWDQEGVSITAWGERRILVRAPANLQAGVAALLSRLLRDGLPTVVVDVAAFRGDVAAARGEGGLGAAVVSGALRPLGFVRASTAPRGQSSARQGGMRAAVIEHDVQVAQKSKITDPIVGIADDGLCADVRVLGIRGAAVGVRVLAWFAAVEGITPMPVSAGETVEQFQTEGRSCYAALDLPATGAWVPVPATSQVLFAVRLASMETPDVGASGAEGARLDVAAALPPMGALEPASFDLGALVERVGHARGRDIYVLPSNYTPPEPPELPDPEAPLPGDFVVDLVKTSIDPDSWTQEGTSLEIRGDRLYARTDAARRAAIEEFLARARARLLQTTRVRAACVAMPRASLPELWTGLHDALAKDGGTALLARAGARLLDSASLRLRDGQRLASVGGHERAYVSDYDPEIAEDSNIANPVCRSLFEGISLDVQANPVASSPLVLLDVRYDRGHLREMRKVKTVHGAIECPNLAVERLRGRAVLSPGAPRILGAWADGEEAILLIVSAARD